MSRPKVRGERPRRHQRKRLGQRLSREPGRGHVPTGVSASVLYIEPQGQTETALWLEPDGHGESASSRSHF